MPPVAASTFVLDWDNPRFTAPARWIGETTQWLTLGWAVVVLGRRLG